MKWRITIFRFSGVFKGRGSNRSANACRVFRERRAEPLSFGRLRPDNCPPSTIHFCEKNMPTTTAHPPQTDSACPPPGTAANDVLQKYAGNRGVTLRVDRQRGIIAGVMLLGAMLVLALSAAIQGVPIPTMLTKRNKFRSTEQERIEKRKPLRFLDQHVVDQENTSNWHNRFIVRHLRRCGWSTKHPRLDTTVSSRAITRPDSPSPAQGDDRRRQFAQRKTNNFPPAVSPLFGPKTRRKSGSWKNS